MPTEAQPGQGRICHNLMNLHSRLFSLLFPIFLPVLFYQVLPAEAAQGDPAPQASLDHNPVYSVTAGKSVPVSVTFADPREIAEMRLYFKTMAADEYLFLPMTISGKVTYTASIPPAGNWTKGVDYLLLRKNTRGEVRKTKPFRLLIQNDFSASPPSQGEIPVQTEHRVSQAENLDFAVPLRVVMTTEPLLAEAVEDPYPPITVPGPGSGRSSGGMLGGPGGVSFSIKAGGIGFTYRSFSGQ